MKLKSAENAGYLAMDALDYYIENVHGKVIVVIEPYSDFVDYLKLQGIGYMTNSTIPEYHVVIGKENTSYDVNIAFARAFARDLRCNGVNVLDLIDVKATQQPRQAKIIAVA